MAIKKDDFVEIEYTGKLKDDDVVIDTTSEKIAKEKEIFNANMRYGPIVVCVGQNQVLKGLDDDLSGKEINKEYKVEISPENGFGKKDAAAIKIVPTTIFIKQKINPFPGLQVQIDGVFGTIKTVTGGRTVVDFNHPFSGKTLSYSYKLNKLVTDDVEKVKHFLSVSLNVKDEGFTLERLNDGGVKITFLKGVKLDKIAKDSLSKKIKEVIPTLKYIEFGEETEKKEE